MSKGYVEPRNPDSRDGLTYVIDREVSFAVEVAMATGRPLLLRGEPGSGKSSLASYIARHRNWRYYEHVVTSRTSPRDLLWSFDAVRRLADAQVRAPGEVINDHNYVEPGVLWWAFAPTQARLRGGRAGEEGSVTLATDPNPDNAHRLPTKSVVLIDEIDKADPDMPNGILVPLGSNEFEVAETRTRVRRESSVESAIEHLIVITTNEERELPQAFLRRCVVTWLPAPTHEHLVQVAKLYLTSCQDQISDSDEALIEALATELLLARGHAENSGIRKPSTAEYLDALQALRKLNITLGSDEWKRLRALTLVKVQQPKGQDVP